MFYHLIISNIMSITLSTNPIGWMLLFGKLDPGIKLVNLSKFPFFCALPASSYQSVPTLQDAAAGPPFAELLFLLLLQNTARFAGGARISNVLKVEDVA
jgi:hypothetical protein